MAACSPPDTPRASADSAGIAARAVSVDSVERWIAEIANGVDGSVGFAAVHVPSGARLSHNGAQRYPQRSVYKLPIAVSVLRRVDARQLRLDSTITVTPADFAPLHSPLRDRAAGKVVSVTVDSLLLLMIAESDNTASDVLLRVAGGPGAVMSDLQALGISGVRVDRTERELAAARDAESEQRDTATPDAIADLLVAIATGRGLSAESHKRLLDIMERTRTGPNRIRALLPTGARVAHKTGTGTPMTNDAGLVTLPGGAGQVAIVVFVRSTAESVNAREGVIAKMARAAYDYFSARSGALHQADSA